MSVSNPVVLGRRALLAVAALVAAAIALSLAPLAPMASAQTVPSLTPTATATSGATATPAPTEQTPSSEAGAVEAVALRAELTRLLQSHVYLVGLAGEAAVEGRQGRVDALSPLLAANGRSIAAVAGQYYGGKVREDLRTALASRVDALLDYARAASDGDKNASREAMSDLDAATERIAESLSGASDAWSADELAHFADGQPFTRIIDAQADDQPVEGYRLLVDTAGRAAIFAGMLADGIVSDNAEAFEGRHAEIRNGLRRTVEVWNQRDAEAFMAGWTEEGLRQEFEIPPNMPWSGVRQQIGNFIGNPPIDIRAIEVTEAGQSEATVELELEFGAGVDRARHTMVPRDGRWEIDSSEALRVEAPEGAVSLPVEMSEYAFTYQRGRIPAGEQIVFEAENVGSEAQELVMLRIDEDAPALDQLLAETMAQGPGAGPPASVEFLAAVVAEPGEGASLVLSAPLSEGRYAMVCFIPTEQGVPHAFLGMHSEFTVEASGEGGSGTTPTPSP
ncbi:MAG: hypothetical protein FJ318_07615 [SAR202 cluster bacterium]|nr:hypothetical protein [SAR202 cluster bacterium]